MEMTKKIFHWSAGSVVLLLLDYCLLCSC
uniref:Uncharacterized protein n=1 Tax=Anguilla anguilla TaxID=7936 RepID=A0A0E9Q110_ANGAN